MTDETLTTRGVKMHSFTIEGVPLSGEARVTGGGDRLLDLRVTAPAVDGSVSFAWVGRKLLFEGEAIMPSGQVEHVRWYVILSGGRLDGGAVAFRGAGRPEAEP